MQSAIISSPTALGRIVGRNLYGQSSSFARFQLVNLLEDKFEVVDNVL